MIRNGACELYLAKSPMKNFFRDAATRAKPLDQPETTLDGRGNRLERERGLHPRHVSRPKTCGIQELTPTNSTHKIHGSKTKNFALCIGIRALSRARHVLEGTYNTKPDSKSMRMMPLCLWGV
jgi:hypothetical protein